MDELPVLFVKNGVSRWVRVQGGVDAKFAERVENLISEGRKLTDELRGLGSSVTTDDVLARIDNLRGLLRVPTVQHGGVEELWFERLVDGEWTRTTEALTDEDGGYEITVTAEETGFYRARFEGTAAHGELESPKELPRAGDL
jgi:hypothetical protein